MLKLKLTLVNTFTEEEYSVEEELETTWVHKADLQKEVGVVAKALVSQLNSEYLR